MFVFQEFLEVVQFSDSIQFNKELIIYYCLAK